MGNGRRLKRSLRQSTMESETKRPAYIPVPIGDLDAVARAVKEGGYPDKGEVNGYLCESCGTVTLIEHADCGVTPMFLVCRAQNECQGQSHSLGYPRTQPPPSLYPIRWEWYRPTKDDPVMLDPEMRDHVYRGGLALREKVLDGEAEVQRPQASSG